jgi:hypothetical protein
VLVLAVLPAIGAGCNSTRDAGDDTMDTPSLDGNATSPSQRPEETEVWEPVPPVVVPGWNGAPPSDAIVLFDGSDLSAWSAEDGSAAGWRVEGGAMTVVPGAGNIRTRRGFGDLQLHIEWRTPAEISGDGQGRGNSGIYFMERYELQVLDSYDNRTYSNGQAGAIYKQHIPMVNASRAPGEWQHYDVAFTAPRFGADGSLASPASMIVFHNGVLIRTPTGLRSSCRTTAIRSATGTSGCGRSRHGDQAAPASPATDRWPGRGREGPPPCPRHVP